LPADLARELEIEVVPLKVLVDDREYENDLEGNSIGVRDFYAMLRAGKRPTTSCPSLGDYLSRMEPRLEKGEDLLYLGFSSALSSSYQNGCMAVNMLKEDYPDREIRTVDTWAGSLGLGLLVREVAKLRREGICLEEAAKFAERLREKVCHWFSVADMGFLNRGGRVTQAVATLGAALKLRPILGLKEDHSMSLMGVVHGEEAMLKALLDKVRQYGESLAAQTLYVGHADCPELAGRLRAMITKELGLMDFFTYTIGPVMGAHCGPDCLAVFFTGRQPHPVSIRQLAPQRA